MNKQAFPRLGPAAASSSSRAVRRLRPPRLRHRTGSDRSLPPLPRLPHKPAPTSRRRRRLARNNSVRRRAHRHHPQARQRHTRDRHPQTPHRHRHRPPHRTPRHRRRSNTHLPLPTRPDARRSRHPRAPQPRATTLARNRCWRDIRRAHRQRQLHQRRLRTRTPALPALDTRRQRRPAPQNLGPTVPVLTSPTRRSPVSVRRHRQHIEEARTPGLFAHPRPSMRKDRQQVSLPTSSRQPAALPPFRYTLSHFPAECDNTRELPN